jgi:penicillin-binding protein 1A
MARKRRRGERVEPVLDSRGPRRDGTLEFGLKESDRPTAKIDGGRRKRAKTFGRAEKPKQNSKRRAGKGGGSSGGIGRVVRRTAYWCVVLGIWTTVALVAVVGFYATKLPPTSEWVLPKRPANVQIVAVDGTLITNRGDTGGASLTLDEMPPFLPQAVIAIEDRRFYHHFGIDPIGLARAFVADIKVGGIVQGGSTLTQQLAKNLFLKPERTFERKIQEVVLALWLEAKLSKKQILELYLNRVYLGAGAYGVDAAAHRYFGKSARDITLAEAATIAGLLKAPARYSPLVDPAAAEGRAQVVLAAMHSAGFIGDREASLAMSAQVKAVRDIAGGSGRYVADWVTDILPSFVGAIDQDIVVDTTIDLRLQAAAARAVAATLDEQGQKLGVSEGAFVAIDPTGAVKALVGGRDYATSPFNRAVDGMRQPGSAFKPFVYLTALENGLTPETIRIDQPVSIKGWQPKNYSKEYMGPVTLQTALALSLNTISVQLTAEVGPKAVAATARRLGITSPLVATPSIALGTSEVDLLEMTGAFVPFSNGGTGVIPHVIKRITTADGKVLYERSGSGPGQVIAPAYVGMMNSMLKQTLEQGTGKRAAVPGWPAAGKTGTSQDFRDAWFIGYTAVLTAGVWFGNDDGAPTKKASGSNLPAIAWRRFMTEALAGLAVADLPGNYRFRDPSHFATGAPPDVVPPRPVTASGDDGPPQSLLPPPPAADAGQPVPEDNPGFPVPPADLGAPSTGPVPPADVGGDSSFPQPRRPAGFGFFKKIFGGG